MVPGAMKQSSRLNAILNRETLIRCLLREYIKKRANFFKVGKTRL